MNSQTYPEGLTKQTITVPRMNVPFKEAVRLAGPWTPYISPEKKVKARARGEILIDSLIWQAEDLYRDVSNPESGDVTLTLLNFGIGSRTAGPTALLIGKMEGLRPASPFEVFAVGANMPALYGMLATEPAGILSPEPRMLDGVNRACCVWLGSAQKECAFVPFDHPLHDGYWFAFVYEEEQEYSGILAW